MGFPLFHTEIFFWYTIGKVGKAPESNEDNITASKLQILYEAPSCTHSFKHFPIHERGPVASFLQMQRQETVKPPEVTQLR